MYEEGSNAPVAVYLACFVSVVCFRVSEGSHCGLLQKEEAEMSYTEKELDKIWAKGKSHSGKGDDATCKDAMGNKIRRGSYGSLTKMGWEVDHINPKAKGGSDDISNLRPLHWEANREKADGS